MTAGSRSVLAGRDVVRPCLCDRHDTGRGGDYAGDTPPPALVMSNKQAEVFWRSEAQSLSGLVPLIISAVWQREVLVLWRPLLAGTGTRPP